VLNEDYLTRYYKTRGSCGHSIQDLQLECMEDPELSPFESRSIDMRVLTGQTSLFCKVSCPPAAFVSFSTMHPERAVGGLGTFNALRDCSAPD
jgi:hypothetical protein